MTRPTAPNTVRIVVVDRNGQIECATASSIVDTSPIGWFLSRDHTSCWTIGAIRRGSDSVRIAILAKRGGYGRYGTYSPASGGSARPASRASPTTPTTVSTGGGAFCFARNGTRSRL